MKNFALILMSLLMVCCTKDDEVKAQTMTQKMYITIDGQAQAVTLVDNQATKTLVEKLQQTPVTVTLSSSGGFEIWGALGFSLPTSNEQINAQLGDVILYNGSNICIFYGTNSWSYTRLGKIDNAVMILHGEKAHSRYFGITAYENMTGAKVDLQGQDANLQPLNEPLAEPFIVTRGNKQLYIVPGATHCDLYDGGEKSYIPFDKLEAFFRENMK